MAYDFLGVMHQRHWDALKAFTQASISELDPFLSNRQDALKRKIRSTEKYLDSLKLVATLMGGEKLPYKNADGTQDPYEGADYPMVLREGENRPGVIPIENLEFRAMVQKGEIRPATIVSSLKKWQQKSIKFKKERLEFKIKRAYDLIDYLYKELEYLNSLWPEPERDSEGNIVDPSTVLPNPVPEVENIDTLFADPLIRDVFLYSGDIDPYDDRGVVRDV